MKRELFQKLPIQYFSHFYKEQYHQGEKALSKQIIRNKSPLPFQLQKTIQRKNEYNYIALSLRNGLSNKI